MPAHIGIVACSSEGAALCYRTICSEAARHMGEHAHPEITLHGLSLADYVVCLQKGDLRGVADLMLKSATKLSQVGADFLVCPDNTIHAAFPHVVDRSPLPWLHIAEVVAEEARVREFRRVGLLGTKWLVNCDVYPQAFAKAEIDYLRPGANEVDEIDRIIMNELVNDRHVPESVVFFRQVIERLAGRGCDAVLLGCTEIPLIISHENSALPILDSTRLLARAAVRRAVAQG